jgi:hypothetical protein
MKSIVRFISRNKFLHLFLAVVTVGAGLNEVAGTILSDFMAGKIHGGHGVVTIGLWHLCKSLSDIVEASDYFSVGMKS